MILRWVLPCSSSLEISLVRYAFMSPGRAEERLSCACGDLSRLAMFRSAEASNRKRNVLAGLEMVDFQDLFVWSAGMRPCSIPSSARPGSAQPIQ